MNRTVWTVIIQCLLLGTAAAAFAQGKNPPPGREPRPQAAAEQAPRPTPEAPPQQKPLPPRGPDEPRLPYKPVVLRLQNADCMEVAKMVEEVFFEGTVVPIQRTNSIIYAGPEDTLAQVTELLGKMDLPASDAETSELTMIPVHHRHVEDLADQVMKMLSKRGERDARLAADKGRSMLLIRGPKSVVEMARSIVGELDQPAGSVVLEFAFFHADQNRKEPFSTIPADLAQVAQELQRFGALELLGRLSTIAVENDKFRVAGSIADNIPQVQVEGQPTSVSADGTVNLRLMARMVLDHQSSSPPVPPAKAAEDKEKPAPPSGARPAYELDTSVQAKRGDYIVLGSAPAGWKPGESVILVMYVRP